ncbi:MAG: NifB/NifX family molybdenum-iron cluster-binding protein [Opitutales bacterium]|nr:NifB/NifX family molybdenum-iron cluster-binding protein [Opitutales bacterium]
MKVAIPLTGGTLCEHFGHCEQFAIADFDAKTQQFPPHSLATPPPHEPGVFPSWLRELGVNAVIAGGMGRRALDLFAENGISIHAGSVGEAPEALLAAFAGNALANGLAPCKHDHEHGHEHC